MIGELVRCVVKETDKEMFDFSRYMKRPGGSLPAVLDYDNMMGGPHAMAVKTTQVQVQCRRLLNDTPQIRAIAQDLLQG